MATRTKSPEPRQEHAATVRFEASLGPAPRTKAIAAASVLGLDRLPDAQGRVRLLITVDDARRLLDQGFEVHLKAAVPVAPLARDRVMSDAQARRWLEEQVKGIPREGGR